MTESTVGGWPTIEKPYDSRLAVGKVPGTNLSIRMRKEVLPVFLAFLAEVNKKVIPLKNGPLDGWTYRKARAVDAFSQHAGGVATDMRYDILKADRKIHMTDTQHKAMHKLLDKYVTSNGKRVFGWGGDWTPGKFADEMHVEAIQNWSPGSQGKNATVDDFRNVQKRLRIRNDGTVSAVGQVVNIVKPTPKPPANAPKPLPKPVGAPKPIPVPENITTASKVRVNNVQPGSRNRQVAAVQVALRAAGFDPKAFDGYFGASTKAAYSQWQKSLGYSGDDANGKPGVKTLTELGKRYGFTVED